MILSSIFLKLKRWWKGNVLSPWLHATYKKNLHGNQPIRGVDFLAHSLTPTLSLPLEAYLIILPSFLDHSKNIAGRFREDFILEWLRNMPTLLQAELFLHNWFIREAARPFKTIFFNSCNQLCWGTNVLLINRMVAVGASWSLLHVPMLDWNTLFKTSDCSDGFSGKGVTKMVK